ncbi:mitochondrial 54S ribosomal protein YmL3 [Ophiocordyceps camponoti-floridani]|uniref:Large ribosomal subunit protein mL44 n=1 Tax=Ophiocordyceps camponoti-floridani TaxID=2030778 RepID=A0A8H4Q6C7_9HYPO|nr:mitochondrial 54S ribosomal protein YmL3 [Ophiocordyceps camponoti-floridani]
MKRLRLARWSGPALHARPGATLFAVRGSPFLQTKRCQHEAAAQRNPVDENTVPAIQSLPSPPPSRAASSAKLAALHARLSLSDKIPIQTLARVLISPTADPNPAYNNSTLSCLGSCIINYHVLEYLVCKWPRLPIAILYETLRAYAGDESLRQVCKRWGVEPAAAPGEEVDPGLLQWKPERRRPSESWWGYVRADVERNEVYRRGLSSRIVLDNDFGDMVEKPGTIDQEYDRLHDEAFAAVVQAAVGAVYSHCGRDAAKSFVVSHILSRQFDPSVLFAFKLPTRELALLCAREGFEPPLARLESETGRLSRTPVYVVAIYSGQEKLGEGAGPSLDIARRKACMVSLKAWYLYSPGNRVRVPSEMVEEGAKPWTPPHIDIGEII